MAVDPGLTVSSSDGELTGATVSFGAVWTIGNPIYPIGVEPLGVDSPGIVANPIGIIDPISVPIEFRSLILGDTLNFTNKNGITGTYSDGVLTLSGVATVAQIRRPCDRSPSPPPAATL